MWSINGGELPPSFPSLFVMWKVNDDVWLQFLTFLVILLVLHPIFADALDNNSTQVIKSRNGAVAADDVRCSKIGRNVLHDGGHAVDAMVAVTLCLGVVSPASSGLGGGAFMVLRLANGQSQAFDMRETAPLRASQNMYAGNTSLKANGALSIGVPGELAGIHEAWKQHGRLPWKRLVAPATRLARHGFRISPYLHKQMVKTESGILADEGLREIFSSNGHLLNVGDVCTNHKLADTLNSISLNGPKVFYDGPVGSKLVEDIKRHGGIVTLEDLKSYKVKVTPPISARVMGLDILTMPPPSSGGAGLILISKILEQYGFPSGISGSLGLHRIIESLKHNFAVRMNLGDPDFVNVSNALTDMLSDDFAIELKSAIFDNETFNPSHYGGKWNVIHDHGTSHFCIVDAERNAVSMTSTINSYFGSLIRSTSTGIVLNNEMDDFSIPSNHSANGPPPAPANFISPLKRPLSSMTPTIVLKDGQLSAVVGASGGAMIIAATTEVFLNHFGKGLDPVSSVMAPRVYHQLIPNVVLYENWTSASGHHFEVPGKMISDLHKKGHVLEALTGGSVCQFIVHGLQHSNKYKGVAIGELTAVSDPRKGGMPAGY